MCIYNAQAFAQAISEYTPDKLYEFHRTVENAIYTSFSQAKSMSYQLIQAGFPRVVSKTNFECRAHTRPIALSSHPWQRIL